MAIRRIENKESPEEKHYRETVETIAQEVCKLSRQVQALLDGRLTRKATVLLLSASCGLPQATVNQVLDAITGMEGKYLK